MIMWTIKTIPVTNDKRVRSTHIDRNDIGFFYVINNETGYPLDTWTPYDAEIDYVTNTAERDQAFRDSLQ